MRPVLAVIRREYLQRVRSRWFVLGTLGVPFLSLALFVVPARLASPGREVERRIMLVDRTGTLAPRVGEILRQGGWEAEEARTEAVLDSLRQMVRDGEVGAVLVLGDETLRSGRAALLVASRPPLPRAVALRHAVAQAALEVHLRDRRVDVASLLEGGELEVEVLSGPGVGMEDPTFLAAWAGAFVLYMVILVYAVAVMRSVLEEKTGRMVEMLLASMRPWQLMLGKIVGVGAVGLTQLGAWLVMGALLALPFLLDVLPESADVGALREQLPGPGFVGLFLVFFLGGYFLYSGLYAAVGAMCSTEEEAQQAQIPLMLILVVPVVFLAGVLEDPRAPASVFLSLVPLFSPVLMFARAVVGGASGWEVVLSVGSIGVAVLAVAWIAGRIYRVGVLMTGKRPTLPELWRWVREG